MIRRIVGGFALAALFAASAQAQAFPENFTYVTDGGNGQYFNGYQGQFNDSPNPADLGVGFPNPYSSFQIWCVDEYQDININDKYDVWVTPMSSSDFSHTYGGATGTYGQADYLETAALASDMTTGTAEINSQNDNLQYAIWDELGYEIGGGARWNSLQHCPNTYCFTDYDPSTVTADETAADAQVANIHANQWLIITELNVTTRTYQEFITEDTFRPENSPITPEPATMGMLAMGLVGMAGAGLRRRKRRS